MIPAVNVLIFADENLYSLQNAKTFPETPEGNAAAEKKFKEFIGSITRVMPSESRLQAAMDDGYFQGEGVVLITHSTV